MAEETLDLKKVLETAYSQTRRDHYDQAAETLEQAIGKIEAEPRFQDGEDYELHMFREPFEDVLYRELYNPKKEVRNVFEPVGEVYLQYTSALFELGRFEEAISAVQKAIRWSPTYAKNFFEYLELIKQSGDMEEFFRLTIETFRISFVPQDIARCYRNLGYYFLSDQKYGEALACIVMSTNFDADNKQAEQLLYFIEQTGGRNVPKPTYEALEAYGQQYGFPVGASPEILTLSYSYAKHYEEQGNKEGMRYFYTILYNLTGDEEIKAILDRNDDRPRIILS